MVSPEIETCYGARPSLLPPHVARERWSRLRLKHGIMVKRRIDGTGGKGAVVSPEIETGESGKGLRTSEWVARERWSRLRLKLGVPHT